MERRLSVEFQWFLMALSVRPGRRRAMVAHLLPWMEWARRICWSSQSEKGRWWTCGLSWLHHRRRHDLPERPAISLLMAVQLRGPKACTRRRRHASSSGLHGPFMCLSVSLAMAFGYGVWLWRLAMALANSKDFFFPSLPFHH